MLGPSGAAYTCPMTMTEPIARLTTTSVGHALIEELMAGDWDAAASLLSPDVQFRAVTPGNFFELAGRSDVLAQLRRWFTQGWRDSLDGFEDGAVEGRTGMRYQVRWSDEYSRRFVFEQQVYYEVDARGVTWIELMCSGHVPVR